MKHIYEINTAAWLSRLSQQSDRPITLEDIPQQEVDKLALFNIDTVWLMGVWQRSPDAANCSANDTDLMAEIRTVLPDYTTADMIGSAYAIKNYVVDERFGGDAALQIFRRQLRDRGIKLLLDYVPNHTAFDHPWTATHLDYYIHTGQLNDTQPLAYFRNHGDVLIAQGKDPKLAPWEDVAQLNAFSPGYRQASIDTLAHIATMCDGVRCDMAMLMLNDIFASTWGELAGAQPDEEYWRYIVDSIRRQYPEFIFMAECYWQTERQLIELGFDYCYDKTVYDRLVSHDPAGADAYLDSMADIASHLVHFLENHDEPRAATIFADDKNIEYATYINTRPGICLWHDGQFEGYTKKIPVHVGRGPQEATNTSLYEAYRQLLAQK